MEDSRFVRGSVDYMQARIDRYTRRAVAVRLVQWAASRALPNGLMAEQVHPFQDEPLSAWSLTWSHSTFIVTVHDCTTK
jgi:GH15 family glucan-1,4-alpha-glucosidase